MLSPVQRLRYEEAPASLSLPNTPRKFFLGTTESSIHDPLRTPLLEPLQLGIAPQPQSTASVGH
jgi:hypothetical protein